MRGLSLRTVFGTILLLSAIQVVASSKAAAGRVGGALQGLGTATRYLLAPDLPLIPDLRIPHDLRPGYTPTPQEDQQFHDFLQGLGSPLLPYFPAPDQGQTQ